MDASTNGQGRAAEATGQVGYLTASNLRKTYRASQGWFSHAPDNLALDDVSMNIGAGEIMGLVGESGCGKSTLAKVLVGLEAPDSGELTIDGKQIFGARQPPLPPKERDIQMIFQDPFNSLNPRMRIDDVVGEGLILKNELSRKEIRERVRAMLEMVGLGADTMKKYPHQFSGGQRQRICIARAVIMDAKLLIADEAVSALDVSVQMQILNLMLDIRERLGIAILFISHDIGVIEYLCDRVCVMYAGRIVERGETVEVLDNPMHDYTKVLLQARPVLPR